MITTAGAPYLWRGGLVGGRRYLAAFGAYGFAPGAELSSADGATYEAPGYQRILLEPDYWTIAARASNNVAITYPALPEGTIWPGIVAFGLFADAVGGHLLIGENAVGAPVIVTAENPLVYHPGELSFAAEKREVPEVSMPIPARQREDVVLPPIVPLPDPVRINRPSDGSAVVWQWPASWTEVNVRAGLFAVYGAGGGGGSGEHGTEGHANQGGRGGLTTLAQGATTREVLGGEGGWYHGYSPAGGEGASGGAPGHGNRGSGGAGGSGYTGQFVEERENGPVTITLGRGGQGGAPFRSASGGARGLDAWVTIQPVR